MFLPFYAFVFMRRSKDPFVRKGFWVLLLGLSSLICVASFHLLTIERWADDTSYSQPRALYGENAPPPSWGDSGELLSTGSMDDSDVTEVSE